MDLKEIYTQVIMVHNASTRNKRHVEHPTATIKGVNPSCGDEIELELRLSPEGVVEDVAFTGTGCAISQASASVMADLVRGKTLAEARRLEGLFLEMVRDGKLDDETIGHLQEAAAFSNVSHMPARVKCAVLGWHTLNEALDASEAKEGGKDGGNGG
ncbi:Fe-S cluster assembly sulfur transfer protein SufU [Parasphaerochaeta coccoides]|uniref:SUF system FeS assembly protein, NifU family n=1 Tax=Parasphaerochaeta coccoides (strain ATCC BAA-1237 / DSM 17374 / SPN1) TaxID=760011 RepID=F4GLC6_PARC1|nr:SUF system NifU family Fe-S cluster assembly protein [Parasphaerochaeta coccoides]AEC02958.1 SUF system FeS assembly protein, NifU family [Parasphaerochaeta coccoides DSM 17374]